MSQIDTTQYLWHPSTSEAVIWCAAPNGQNLCSQENQSTKQTEVPEIKFAKKITWKKEKVLKMTPKKPGKLAIIQELLLVQIS